MSTSIKYGRTYHYPFSPGTTSDDRFNNDYWKDIQQMKSIIHTEKLDGENNCLSKYGVFARSHAAPTTSPWTSAIRNRWNSIKNDLGDLEIFGENLYAIHSIEYKKIEQHYFVFGIRCLDKWLSWEEVKFYAALFDFPTVPEIKILHQPIIETDFKQDILQIVSTPSLFDSYDIHTNQVCTMEGIVTKNFDEFSVNDFHSNVFKYVRKGHVKTNEHWTRTWKRAKLIWENYSN